MCIKLFWLLDNEWKREARGAVKRLEVCAIAQERNSGSGCSGRDKRLALIWVLKQNS